MASSSRFAHTWGPNQLADVSTRWHDLVIRKVAQTGGPLPFTGDAGGQGVLRRLIIVDLGGGCRNWWGTSRPSERDCITAPSSRRVSPTLQTHCIQHRFRRVGAYLRGNGADTQSLLP